MINRLSLFKDTWSRSFHIMREKDPKTIPVKITKRKQIKNSTTAISDKTKQISCTSTKERTNMAHAGDPHPLYKYKISKFQ